MNIPQKVKIGGLTYTIFTDPGLGPDTAAEILYRDLTIHIHPEIAKEQKERAFLHEILHGIYNNLGYEEQNEKQVDELAGALYALIVDNPGMFSAQQVQSDTRGARDTQRAQDEE
jgi:hypothetical protein